MSHLIIEIAYESRLKAWAAARTPPLRIAYENDQFVPQTGETYLRAFTLPADTEAPDLRGIMRAFTGIFQVNIVGPVGGGSGNIKRVVGELDTLFPMNLRLTSSGIPTQVITPVKQGPAITDDSTYTVSASFTYRADANIS